MNFPLAVGPAIYNIKGEMAKLGISNEIIYYAGHSLGGINLQDFVKNLKDKSGLILLGAYMKLTYENPSVNYGIPVLTIAGELDGLVRITRVGISYEEMTSKIPDNY